MATKADDAQEKVATALEKVFQDSSGFIVIGLTGRTGSGCSTAADILSRKDLELPSVSDSHYSGNEARKYKIIKKYIEKQWHPFQWLQIRTVITRYILALNFAEFVMMISDVLSENPSSVRQQLDSFKSEYDASHKRIKAHLSSSELTIEDQNRKKIEAHTIYFDWLPKFSDRLRQQLQKISVSAYTKIYQTAGDNIRSSGTANSNKFDPEKVFGLSQTINKIIKSASYVSKKNSVPCCLVIDAIRNPYEATFLKERYADFQLIAINTKNENRLAHLRGSHKFSDQQIIELDSKEYPEKLEGYKRYTSQNIQKCIELADIHINNPRTDQSGQNELKSQLAWYVSLMMHPGLVMPTSSESSMQIAYSVKQNSGCISRQVGAVVTDAGYAVKSVGWNNPSQGQVPCLLRNAEDLLNGFDQHAYSSYEKTDEKFRAITKTKFKNILSNPRLNGRSVAFCFKDIQNEVEGEKNQVHTRSLHAEENAFLQIAKFGGQQLKGGILFTTASPCELCAKKAYQLGISQIFYIDPYPGIATSHVLSVGDLSPQLTLFRGAVGRAFHKLYQPIMPYKDELEMLVAVPKMSNRKDLKIKSLEDEISALKIELEKIKEKQAN